MSFEAALLSLAEAVRELEVRFVPLGALGISQLRTDDVAEFKRIAIEAKVMIDRELGALNDFSWSIKRAADNEFRPISQENVRTTRALLQGAVNQIRMKAAPQASSLIPQKPPYVDLGRLAELRASTKRVWDVGRLIRLLEELNIAHANDCHMSVAMLVRAITDHVPPIFGFPDFVQLASNIAGGRSLRGSMKNLSGSLRNIADAHLHVPIRKTEVLPTGPQVDFKADLDVLLAEVVRLLK